MGDNLGPTSRSGAAYFVAVIMISTAALAPISPTPTVRMTSLPAAIRLGI
jgi:hypothetical protein